MFNRGREPLEVEILSMRSDPLKLNEYIKKHRELQQYTTGSISRMLDVTEEHYIKMESGEMPITKEFLTELIRILKLSKKIKAFADTDKPEYARRLLKLRLESNRTQKEVASIIGIAPTTYAGYESGKREPDIKTLINLSTLFKASIDYIVGKVY